MGFARGITPDLGLQMLKIGCWPKAMMSRVTASTP